MDNNDNRKKTNKRKVSNLIKRQLPEFVLSDHPKFAEFVKSYFFFRICTIEISSFTSIDNILLEVKTLLITLFYLREQMLLV